MLRSPFFFFNRFCSNSLIRNFSAFSKHSDVFIHSSAVIEGDVSLGDHVSVWPGVVMRGDVNKISIGSYTNIQDNVTIHCSRPSLDNKNGFPTTIGSRVTIGHLAMLHGCTIHDDVLIGMNAIILDGAVIPSHTIIGAGSLVPPKKILMEPGLYVGRPIRRVRDLTLKEIESIKDNALHYVELKNSYKKITKD